MKELTFILCLTTILCGCSITNEITKYPALCNKKNNNNKCTSYTSLNRTTYQVDVQSQQVGSYMPDLEDEITDQYTNCTVHDTQNWSCNYEDGSGVFGFFDGQYFQNPTILENIEYLSKKDWERY